MDYILIYNELKKKREELHFLKPNLEDILKRMTLAEDVLIASESLKLLKQSFSLEDPYDRYTSTIRSPKGIILIHALYDAAIDLIVENTNIYNPF